MAQSPNRLLATVVGIVYLLIGLFGFFVATSVAYATTQGAVLIGLFGVNGLLSTIHVIVGAALLLAGLAGKTGAKVLNVIFGLGFFVLGIFGLFLHHSAGNVFAINDADVVLHLVTGFLMLVAGLGADKLFKTPVTA